MDCPDRDALSAARDRAYRIHAEARGMFRAHWHTAPPEEFRQLQLAVSESRIELELAERTLESHARVHRCEPPPA
jgi:hypothetical protein